MTATTAWLAVLLCALTTFTNKGIGPLTLGSRELPEPVRRVVVLLGCPLLAALVVTSALADGGRLHVGADTVGVLAAGVLLWRKAPVLVVVLGAAAVTALVRAVG